MELKTEKRENGSFDIELTPGYALVKRYFAFGQTEISFSAVVKQPLGKSVADLSQESLEIVIAHLQGLLNGPADQE